MSRIVIIALGATLILGCNDQPAGLDLDDRSSGSTLLVRRTENLPGAPAVRTEIRASDGAKVAQARWLPPEEADVERYRRTDFWYLFDRPYATDITVSADGRWMAWVEVVTDTLMVKDCYYGQCRSPDLVNRSTFVAQVGSPARTLVTPEYSDDRTPVFSPDGSRIAIVRVAFDGRYRLVTMKRNGSDVRLLTVPSLSPIGRPSWSSDGKEILVRRGGVFSIIDDATGVARPFVPGTPVHSDVQFLGDGHRLAGFSWDNGYVLTLLGKNGEFLGKIDLETETISGSAFTMTGRAMAYCTPISGGEFVVRIVDLPTGAIRRVTPPGYKDCNPIWRRG